MIPGARGIPRLVGTNSWLVAAICRTDMRSARQYGQCVYSRCFRGRGRLSVPEQDGPGLQFLEQQQHGLGHCPANMLRDRGLFGTLDGSEKTIAILGD